MIRYLLFDAVGTLIYPQPSVADIYAEVGRRFGSTLTRGELRGRFAPAYRRVFRDYDDLATNEERERDRWQRVVSEVFEDVPAAAEAILAELWEHFAQPQHWTLFDDVIETWRALADRGFTLGIASNFDARLRRILAGHEVLAACPHVFVSSEVGFAKPAQGYYRGVEARLGVRPEEILIVGDDFENDVAAPRRFGWNAIALDRESRNVKSGTLRNLRELLTTVSTTVCSLTPSRTPTA